MSGSGSRPTGTVPKAKHNSRSKRDHPTAAINHMPNNLDWHEQFNSGQRTRKESNTSTSRMSDMGDEYEENPWLGLPTTSSHNESEDLRWVGGCSTGSKSSNLTPERNSSQANVDQVIPSSRTSLHNSNPVLDEPSSICTKEAEKIRFKHKLELSQRKLDELEQHAAYLNFRKMALQYCNSGEVDEIHQNEQILQNAVMPVRSKVIQHVKPVQQGDLDQMRILEKRIHNLQEFTDGLEALVDEDEEVENQPTRKKMQDMRDKVARMSNLLSYMDANKITLPSNSDCGHSISSEDTDLSALYSRTQLAENPEVMKRDNKQDNRDNSFISNKQAKIEDLRMKLEQLQGCISRIENVGGGVKPSARMSGDGASAQIVDRPQSRDKRQHTKKLVLESQAATSRRPNSNPVNRVSPGLSQSNIEYWTLPTPPEPTPVQYSSDEGEYDESPVKLCPPNSYNRQSNITAKSNALGSSAENSSSLSAYQDRCIAGGCKVRGSSITEMVTRPVAPTAPPVLNMPPPNPGMSAISDPSTHITLQIAQLQNQMERIQTMYQSLVDKQPFHPPPPPPHTLPWTGPLGGFMPFMNPPSQWHQYQLLITSLNQCCQLIWHQQREIAGLRQALNVVQGGGEDVCQGYGHNLNPGLLWQPPLNNQVPPGNRANNYWDNFRSYSRQNLLSARNKRKDTPRPPDADNIRRLENSTLRNSRPGTSSGGGGNSSDVNQCSRELNMHKIKHEHGNDTFSLEQSVYSELESVITEPGRSPQLLLQLLSQLKSLKSQSSRQEADYDDTQMGTGSALEPPENVVEQPKHPEFSKEAIDHVMEQISNLLTSEEMFFDFVVEELLIIIYTSLPVDQHMLASLQTNLAKFDSSVISCVKEQILDLVRSTLSRDQFVPLQIPAEQEEGAVGGEPIAIPGTSGSPHSVETELAEADQRSSSDTIQAVDPVQNENLASLNDRQDHSHPPAGSNQDVSSASTSQHEP